MKVKVVGLLVFFGLFAPGCRPTTQDALDASALGRPKQYQDEDAGLKVVVSLDRNGHKPGDEAVVSVTITNLTNQDLRILPVPLSVRNCGPLPDAMEGWTRLYWANEGGSTNPEWTYSASQFCITEIAVNMLQCWVTLDTDKTAPQQKKAYLKQLHRERAKWNMKAPFYVLPPKASLSKTERVVVETPQWDFGIFSLPEFYTLQQEKKSGETSSSYRPPKIWTGSIYLREAW